MALVSIIIPTYNRAHLIGETLDSIIAQTYTNWECIVVDDGSTDGTIDVLNHYTKIDDRFKYYHRPLSRLRGGNAARNYGLEMSKGEFVNWFDSDDIMLPKKIEVQVKLLASSIHEFTVCQTLVFEGVKENILGLRKKNIYSNNFFDDFITNKIKWLTQAPLFKRQFLDFYGFKFDENLKKSQERDFFVKVLAKVEGYSYDNTPYVLFRSNLESISRGKSTKNKELSSFNVDLRILNNYNDLLDNNTILYLKKSLLSKLKESNFRSIKPRLTLELLKLNFSSKEKFKIVLYLIYNLLTTKGYFIIKNI